MKNIVKIISVFLVLFLCAFSTNIFAAALGNFAVNTSNSTVTSGENVTVTASFGQGLGSYTVDFAYNNNLFEYVSATGGTADDNGTRVRVYFYDQAGGSEPRSSVSATFKAKTVTTATSGNFSITASGLSTVETTVVSYDDITTPVVKTVTVEPVATNTENDTGTGETNNEETPTAIAETPTTTTTNTEKSTETTPASLPKTGITIYGAAIVAIGVLTAGYVYLKKKDSK